MRLGHEWAGTVASVGSGVDSPWLGRQVMGDTQLGDGTCRRCRKGYQPVYGTRSPAKHPVQPIGPPFLSATTRLFGVG
jgi:threonine dehydrogenase-like Zn-dependent dehydrogenase